MAQTVLAEMLERIQVLNADELRQLQQAVQERLEQQGEAAAGERFHRALLASGLVKEIKVAPAGRERERPLVQIQGKPLSETIIEERR